jgi:hypothetical protein
VEVPGVSAPGGKTVKNPELARAGLTVQVAAGSMQLPVLISGAGASVAHVYVVDAAGKMFSAGGSGSSGVGANAWFMGLQRPLQRTDVLVINVPTGLESVRVPIDLRAVPLP